MKYVTSRHTRSFKFFYRKNSSNSLNKLISYYKIEIDLVEKYFSKRAAIDDRTNCFFCFFKFYEIKRPSLTRPFE